MYTTDELKSLKSQWLADNKEFTTELAKACFTIGERVFLYPREFYCLDNGDFTACAFMEHGKFDRYAGTFQVLTTILVYVGDYLRNPVEKQLWARMSTVNFGEVPYHYDNFFVPGDWMDGFQQMIHQAHGLLKNRHAVEVELERVSLLQQLHITEMAEVLA